MIIDSLTIYHAGTHELHRIFGDGDTLVIPCSMYCHALAYARFSMIARDQLHRLRWSRAVMRLLWYDRAWQAAPYGTAAHYRFYPRV